MAAVATAPLMIDMRAPPGLEEVVPCSATVPQIVSQTATVRTSKSVRFNPIPEIYFFEPLSESVSIGAEVKEQIALMTHVELNAQLNRQHAELLEQLALMRKNLASIHANVGGPWNHDPSPNASKQARGAVDHSL